LSFDSKYKLLYISLQGNIVTTIGVCQFILGGGSKIRGLYMTKTDFLILVLLVIIILLVVLLWKSLN